MTERVHIPSSPACGQWETLLPDALDGLLKPEDQATFSAHMAVCASCTALFEESRRGREWLKFLAPEPEVPSGLLARILATTGPGYASAPDLAAPANVVPLPQMIVPAWQKPGFMGAVRRFAEPRLIMTAAMAFFSIALTLNMAGVRLASVRMSNLRPTVLRSFMERQLTMASVPIIRYYDHLRFVYEVESRVRELRGTATESDQENTPPASPGESKQNAPHKDGGSRMDPPQRSASPPADNYGDYLEASLTESDLTAHSGGSATAESERSRKWIA